MVLGQNPTHSAPDRPLPLELVEISFNVFNKSLIFLGEHCLPRTSLLCMHKEQNEWFQHVVCKARPFKIHHSVEGVMIILCAPEISKHFTDIGTGVVERQGHRKETQAHSCGVMAEQWGGEGSSGLEKQGW